ncbi:EspM-like O-methyltransferase [Leptotrombidium deliense]|uniref:EspM-like O-methyltransferase n=1 Tax=Leptotrombidium deliense TaxID=299467 RepID=A0A443RWF8_9ACAR|nr:EspM-like O-methyltransferase [Leptotrombidium deliense]
MVKSGTDCFEEYYGQCNYDWYKSRTKALQTFNIGMSDLGKLCGSKLTKLYVFSQFNRIVDIGRGRGVFKSEMLKCSPKAKSTVYDQPHNVEAVQKNNEEIEAAVKGRISFVGGNCLEKVPSQGECYTIRN